MAGLGLKTALLSNLERDMRENVRVLARAGVGTIRWGVRWLKAVQRAEIAAAGLGSKLPRTVRAKVYPNRGLDAAAVVFSNAPHILQAFNDGVTIRSRAGFWLAVPTENVPKRIRGKRVTPDLLERSWGVRLRFVYRQGQASMLVVDNVRASFSRATGQLRGFRLASQRARRTGTGLTTIVAFWLVPRTKVPKRIDIGCNMRRLERLLPRRYEKEVIEEDRRRGQ